MVENIQWVHTDKGKLIFDQIPIAVIAQYLIAFFILLALNDLQKEYRLTYWFLYMTLVSISWFLLLTLHRLQKNNKPFRRLFYFAVLVFLSGCGWGYLGSILIPQHNYIHQTFIAMVLFGLTAGAIPFFAPVLIMYVLFLLPSIFPFNVWLFMQQNEIYNLLGFGVSIYTLIIFGSCYYTHTFFVTTLALRQKNYDLDSINQLLEKKVSERTQALNKTLSSTLATMESTADGILVIDVNGQVAFYNQNFLNIWGFKDEALKNKNARSLIKKIKNQLNNPNEFSAYLLKSLLDQDNEYSGEIYFKNGQVYEWYSKPNVMDNKHFGRVWSFKVITERKHVEKQLSYQATHDLLTGLPNKTLIYDRIEQAIYYTKRFNLHLVVYFLDIDNFKLINDNLGHHIGDQLLKKIAQRLSHSIRRSDTVARFGGDEFVILFLTNDLEQMHHMSAELLKEIHKPVHVDGYDLIVTCSIGASIYPQDGKDPSTLLRNADMAMYQAKNQGKNNFKQYFKSINRDQKKQLEMQVELYNALLKKEFFLVYQPIVELKTGDIIAAEALIRWQHPDKGLLRPSDFIPYAEKSGFIVQLGKWIFHEACKQNSLWQKEGLKPIRIAINVAAPQLLDDTFEDFTLKTLKEVELDACYVDIELTESTLMEHSKYMIQTMERLKKNGMKIVIDDFGIGYSGLNYLRQFPIDKLKIDSSFVQNMVNNKDDAAIVKAFIIMGKSLNLSLVAEGIEEKEQLELLLANQCPEGQGFLFSQAMEPSAFAQLLSLGKINL